jgi:SAM-dependent methyltransferase
MTESDQDKERNYQFVNRLAWTRLAGQGNDSSRPFDEHEFAQARHWLDPEGWIVWPEIQRVLCLASGGGQQAPMFASLDCRVVSADLCAEQLRRDSESARRYGYEIECIEADMLDLSALHGRDFDLVYQAVSACYVPDVRRLYTEVSRVLRPCGYYRVEHWNPVNMQLADDLSWTGRGYEIVRPTGSAHVWRRAGENGEDYTECWHYIHSLTDQIGGLCDAGFRILHFAEHGHHDECSEPGSKAHAYSYAPPFLSLYAQKICAP